MASLTFRKIRNAFKHAGSGTNVNLLTLARNVLPFYLPFQRKAFTPLTLFFSVNSVCNARCLMCDIGQQAEDSSFFKNLRPGTASDRLKIERVEELLAEAATFNPKPRISVTTTEPLLYKDLWRMAASARDHGLEFQFTTNGYRLERFVEQILDSGVAEVVVSIDGPAEVHDRVRGIPGMLASIRTGLELLRRRKIERNLTRPNVTIATVATNHTYERLAELYQEIGEHLYDRAIVSHMNFMTPDMVEEHNLLFGHIGTAEIAGVSGGTSANDVDIDQLWRQMELVRRDHGKVVFSPDYSRADLEVFYRSPDRFVWNNTCYIPWFVMEILANGDVIPLTRCMHKLLGNVYAQSLAEIWNGKPYREFRQALQRNRRFPICRRCRGIL